MCQLQDLDSCRLRLDPELGRHRYERKISFAGILDDEDRRDSLNSSSHTLKSDTTCDDKKTQEAQGKYLNWSSLEQCALQEGPFRVVFAYSQNCPKVCICLGMCVALQQTSDQLKLDLPLCPTIAGLALTTPCSRKGFSRFWIWMNGSSLTLPLGKD